MTQLRPYQSRAVDHVRAKWSSGLLRVCLVAPTGSGKTTMGATLCAGFERVVWIAHRRELVAQAVERLRGDGLRVGAICPGLPEDSTAPVQVGTVQTLMARDVAPPADLVVLDEAHHYAPGAEKFSEFVARYPFARILGLTATPARRDGSPLGDVFQDLVVAATYSELIEAGHIAKCRVFAPPEDSVEGGWALDPVEAYKRHAEDSTAFAFFDRVQRAEEWRDNFNLAGIRAAVISDKTKPADRERYLEELGSGALRVVCNVYTMTEGVDVPSVRTCILARPFSHPSMYLQAVGRVLRPHPNKPHALLLDLVDASSSHGCPTDDRDYSLTGDAITVSKNSGHRACPECGLMFKYGVPQCPGCGWSVPRVEAPEIVIWNVSLRRVYRGADTADEHKESERDRLLLVAQRKGWSIGWVVKEYKKLFASAPDLSFVATETKRHEYTQLRRLGIERGYKPGFAAVRFKETFGYWPPRDWANDNDSDDKGNTGT